MQLQCNVNVLHCCEHSGDCSSARSVGPCGHWWPLTRPHTVSILSWYRGAPHTGMTQGRASYWANAGASLTVSILPWCRGEPHTGLIRGRASCEGLGHGAGKTQNQAEPDPNATLLIFACRSFEHKLMDWLTNWHMDTLWKLIKTWQANKAWTSPSGRPRRFPADISHVRTLCEFRIIREGNLLSGTWRIIAKKTTRLELFHSFKD